MHRGACEYRNAKTFVNDTDGCSNTQKLPDKLDNGDSERWIFAEFGMKKTAPGVC